MAQPAASSDVSMERRRTFVHHGRRRGRAASVRMFHGARRMSRPPPWQRSSIPSKPASRSEVMFARDRPVVDDDRVVSVDLMTDAGTAPNNGGLCEQTSTPSSGSPVRRCASRRLAASCSPTTIRGLLRLWIRDGAGNVNGNDEIRDRGPPAVGRSAGSAHRNKLRMSTA